MKWLLLPLLGLMALVVLTAWSDGGVSVSAMSTTLSNLAANLGALLSRLARRL